MRINYRRCSDQGMLQLFKDNPYTPSTNEPHFNASNLPYIGDPDFDNLTSPCFVDDEKRYKMHCNRKIVFDVAGVPKQEQTRTVAELRNLRRGQITEWIETSHIGRHIEKIRGFQAVYQRDLDGNPPDELKIKIRRDYGLAVTGRCDMKVFNRGQLVGIMEIKSPRTGNFDYGDACYINGSKIKILKPQTSYCTQLGWYSFCEAEPGSFISGTNYIVSGGDSQYAQWFLELDFLNGAPRKIILENDLSKEQLTIGWERIAEGIRQATKDVNTVKQALEAGTNPMTLKHLVKSPCTKKDKYPCSWNGNCCGFYDICWG